MIYTAAQLGLRFDNLFGELGPERFVTGHYTAGPAPLRLKDNIALIRSYHAGHKAKGWGGIGYHFWITPAGHIICLRPTILKGAHVGGYNTGNVGVVCPGSTGTRPTAEQAASYRWLLANAHTRKLPPRHRTDLRLSSATLRGHNDWPGHYTNGCPGRFKTMYLTGGRRR